jgi:putative two-component system response regulator
MALTMLADAGHYNDTDTGTHIWRVAAYAGALARAIGWEWEEALKLALGAALHDTGKIGIPDNVLKKPSKLTESEFTTIQNHTEIGHAILHHSDHPGRIFELGAEIALGHHEKWDGSGYPKGVMGTNIPESARITAVVDVFDALTMERSYKKGWTNEKAFDLIRKESGLHFDPAIVQVFFSIQEELLELQDKWRRIEKNNLLHSDLEAIISQL